jgi:cellulose synthase (UDP-forming)
MNTPTGNEKRGSGIGRALLILPFVAALLLLIRMPLSPNDQVVFSAILVLCCIVLGRISRSSLVTSALAIISICCTLRYIVWRWSSSISFLNNSGWNVDRVGLVFALLLLCSETYAVVILLLGYFQSARSLKRRPVPMPSNTDIWPAVDVFIPTYNETLQVVRPTVLAAMGIDWPSERLNIYILVRRRMRCGLFDSS